MPKQKLQEVELATLSIQQQAAYRQGYLDYESSVRNNQLSISKSNYNPAAEIDELYRAGWDQAAEDHHRNLARREGLKSIIMGMVATTFGAGAAIVMVVTTMNSMENGDYPLMKQAMVPLMAISLLTFGARTIWLGVKTISSPGRGEDHDSDQPREP